MFILCSLFSDFRPDTAHQIGSLVLLSASQRHWIPILCPSQISLSVYHSHFPSSDLLVFISVFHSFTSFPPLSSALFTYHKPRSSFSFLFLQAWHEDNIFHKDFNICGSSFMKPFQIAARVYSSLYIALLQDCYYCYLDDTFTTSLLISEFKNQRKVKL